MTAPYRKKLIEVSLPLAAISDESSRRKRKAPGGYPTTFHKWWAQRPLAACRAVLFASMVDDPDSDPQYRKPDGSVDEERAGIKRADLFNLIEELVAWENSNNPDIIRSARAEIARCVASRKIELKELDPKLELAPKVTVYDLATRGHCRPKAMGLDKKAGRVRFAFDVSHLPPADVVNKFLAEHAPPVLDPFAGGGSIPLEAQRLGLRAYASDLNPVPVLINKALIEIPPKFAGRLPVNPESRGEGSGKSKGKKKLIEHDWPGATGLAEDVRYYGKWMRDEAEKRIGHLYPKVKITVDMAKDRPDLKEYIGQELTVIAWLWARTVASSNPACNGVHVPLVRSFWLSTKKGKETYVEPIIDRKKMSYRFVVRIGKPADTTVVDMGTKVGRGCKFRCMVSEEPIPETHIKAAGIRNDLGTALLAVVAEGTRGRVYLSPGCVPPIKVDRPRDLNGLEAPLADDPRNLWCLGYGLNTFDKLFTPRQLVALTTFSDLVGEARDLVKRAMFTAGLGDDTTSSMYADAVVLYLAASLSRVVDYNSSLASWRPKDNAMRSTFAKQALPMVWDFAEANPFEKSSAGFKDAVKVITDCIRLLPARGVASATQQDVAKALPIAKSVICTDPPYYDNIGYADLSDYFYIWLRRSLSRFFPDLFATVLAPKQWELIASPYRHDGSRDRAKTFFEEGFVKAFSLMRDHSDSDYPLTVFYAFKQAESDDGDTEDTVDDVENQPAVASTGWETMLEGLIRSGFGICGTWPMRTEGDNRQVGIGANALASSIVLVCRPRPADAQPTTRKEFLTALRRELPDALRSLQHGNIAPVDLAQSAIGPGMAVFTRYSKVMETDGSPMSVRTALGIINQVLDEVLAEQEGEFDGDTRWALAWFEQFGMKEEAFGVAETLSKAKNTAVNGLVEAGVIVAKSGKVRLLKRDELPDDWDPATDRRLTVWESVQHLIRVLETQGEEAAGDLVKTLGSQAETCRDLAYRLYSICERKKWAEEALAYNALVIAWPELVRLSLASNTRPRETQAQLFS